MECLQAIPATLWLYVLQWSCVEAHVTVSHLAVMLKACNIQQIVGRMPASALSNPLPQTCPRSPKNTLPGSLNRASLLLLYNPGDIPSSWSATHRAPSGKTLELPWQCFFQASHFDLLNLDNTFQRTTHRMQINSRIQRNLPRRYERLVKRLPKQGHKLFIPQAVL